MMSGVGAALGSALLPGVGAGSGVAALVLKPGVLGGLERTWRIAVWAAGRGMQVWSAPCTDCIYVIISSPYHHSPSDAL